MPRSPSPPQFSLIAVRADAFFIVVRALGQELIPMIGPVGLEYWPESREKVSSAGRQSSSWHARTCHTTLEMSPVCPPQTCPLVVLSPCPEKSRCFHLLPTLSPRMIRRRT